MLPFFAAIASISAVGQVSPPKIETPDRPIEISDSAAPFAPSAILGQTAPDASLAKSDENEIAIPQKILPLPGELDEVPVFNSNNPEIVQQGGILLSTFPAEEMKFPEAHLDYAFKGRFDLFSHHIAKNDFPKNTPTLFLGILVKNASSRRKNVVDILQAASYLGTPDAPYIPLPPMLPNDVGRVYSGPGGRVSDVILRGIRQANWTPHIELEPDESVMLMNVPMPLPTGGNDQLNNFKPRVIKPRINHGKNRSKRIPSSNARSTFLRMKSKNKVYIASMAMFAPLDSNGREKIPTLRDWQNLLNQGRLVQPRDRAPSELNSKDEKFFYGRVSGVSRGSEWSTQITDDSKSKQLTIPEPGESVSYVISTLQRGTFGTGQIQSAPMEVRYPDTAYLAHGNYGVHYRLTLPLKNSSKTTQTVSISFQTPIKDDQGGELKFYKTPPSNIFFRGTVRLRYRDDKGTPLVRYFHLVHRRGEMVSPLATVTLEPDGSRLISLDFVYPPDATPPQVLTIKTN